MTYEEFHARTGYVCGHKEFSSIVSEYNYCVLTKDEFCRRWTVMNRERIITNKCLQNKRDMAVAAYMSARKEWWDYIERYKANPTPENLDKQVEWENEMKRCEELVESLEKGLYNPQN